MGDQDDGSVQFLAPFPLITVIGLLIMLCML